MTTAITGQPAQAVHTSDTGEAITSAAGQTKIPEARFSEELVGSVAENGGAVKAQTAPLTDKEIEDTIKANIPAGEFSLLSEQDENWLKIAVEMFRILMTDSLSQRALRDRMEGLVRKLAEKLKDHKYKEADINVRAAIAGAVTSVVIATLGAVVSRGSIGAAAPTASGIGGQALTSVTQSVSNMVNQIIAADATREQGKAELTRAEKEIVLSGMTAHSKSSDSQQELVKKLMDLISRFFETRVATQSQLINNARN